MPTYYRRDDDVLNGIGDAIPNTAVSYFLQPSLALATIYNDPNGDLQLANPQVTDGLGHTAAYMAAGYYTIVYSGPQILTATFPDQAVGPFGGGGMGTPFSGTPIGTIDGSNTVFTMVAGSTPLTSIPSQYTVWLNFPLVPGVGFTVAVVSGVVKITFAVAPQTGDTLWDEGWL